MNTVTFVDFKALKDRVSIHQCMQMLGLQLRQHSSQFRGACPVHGGGDRTLVVTPGKGFYCFASSKGGDQIQLVAHVRECAPREAAEQIDKYFGGGSAPAKPAATAERVKPAVTAKTGLQPLSYLEATHEAVQALGVSAGTAGAWGAGYAGKGIMRGRFAVPIHDRDGVLLAYVGIAVSEEQSPRLHFPNGFHPESVIFGAERIQAGELYLVRDPLQVLTAYESGVENVVSFLSPITPQSLEMLASLCDEKKVETIELF